MQISLIDLNVYSFGLYFELVKSSQVNSVSCHSSSEHWASMTYNKRSFLLLLWPLTKSFPFLHFLLDYSPPFLSAFHFYVVLGF